MSELHTGPNLEQLNKVAIKEVVESKKPINVGRLINFAIITSEYQTAQEVAKKLRQALPSIYVSAINDRVDELEQQSRNELMMAFNLLANEHQLEKTPIFPDDEFEVLVNYYLATASDYYVDPLKIGMNVLSLIRLKSPVLYFLNPPIHKVWQFLNAPEYQAMLSDSAVTDQQLLRIHETLFYIFNLESSKFGNIMNDLSILDIETIDTLELDTVIA